MSTKLKINFLRGILILAVISGIFMMIVAPSITKLLGFAGFICLVAGGGSLWRQWDLLQMTIPEIHEKALAGQLPRRAPWQTALTVLGLGLFVLAQWRGCSGLQ